MASGHSDYSRGSMPVKSQSGTFSGFMEFTIYGGCAVAVIVVLPILIFALHMAWFPALLVTLIFGVILGAVFKLKAIWYGILAALAVSTIGIALFLAIIS